MMLSYKYSLIDNYLLIYVLIQDCIRITQRSQFDVKQKNNGKYSIIKERLLLKAINFKISNEKLSSLVDANVIACHKTRLGGDLIHILMSCQKEAFVKVGQGYERLEIIREYENISSLQGYLPVPKIYDYMNTNEQAVIVLEKMPGSPFHCMVSSLGRHNSLLLIKDILNTLLNIPDFIKKNFQIGIHQNLKNIKSLIMNDKIRQDSFRIASKGRFPKEVYNKIQNDLKKHMAQTLCHGDLCLPNILVTSKGKWSLIDWGNGGLGDPCQDLSALEGSLNRNLDHEAFPDLCKMINIEMNIDFQKKTDTYKLIDLFWHHAILKHDSQTPIMEILDTIHGTY